MLQYDSPLKIVAGAFKARARLRPCPVGRSDRLVVFSGVNRAGLNGLGDVYGLFDLFGTSGHKDDKRKRQNGAKGFGHGLLHSKVMISCGFSANIFCLGAAVRSPLRRSLDQNRLVSHGLNAKSWACCARASLVMITLPDATI